MNAVTFLIVYAAAVSWLSPVILTKAEVPYPRLAVTGWLAAVSTVIAAWVSALTILMVGAVHALVTSTALTFCVETLGVTDAVQLPTSMATATTVGLLTLTTAVAVYTGRRVLVTALRIRRSNHDHAEAVTILGRRTQHHGVLSIDADKAAVYCVSAGRKTAIVATTGALKLLDSHGLAAVLAHERAHLRGHHHIVVGTLNALAAALPRLPLMRDAAQYVPTLLEMCADDAAVRAHGRTALVTSLVLLSTGHRLPAGALAAAGTAVLTRVLRLTRPAESRVWHTWPYAGMVTATSAAPTIAILLCS